MDQKQRKCLAVTLATALTLTTSCAATHSGGKNNALEVSANACKGAVHSYLAVDVTGSGRANQSLDAITLKAVESGLGESLVCSGRARVALFGSSSAASEVVFNEDVAVRGATANAKARQAQPKLDEVTAKVKAAAAKAMPGVDVNGSDPVGQLGLVAEWRKTLPAGDVSATIVTDGLQNREVSEQDIFADPQAAAAKFTVPNLSGVKLRIVGIGKTQSGAMSTKQVNALNTFYTALCHRAQAAACEVATETTR